MLVNRSKKLRKAIKEKDFSTLYYIFEQMFNPYPCQMGRYEAFRLAVSYHLITEELETEARKYYGNLWHYVGD